jgi:cobalt-zinc-cadmium efflux system protein
MDDGHALGTDGHDHDHEHTGTSRAHGHSHTHGASVRAGSRFAGRLRITFFLTLAFLVVQAVVGIATSSLAVLSDAGHMATDVLGVGMALAAIHAAGRPEIADHRTFGLYRLEILAALANAVLLFGVAIYVGVEAIDRFRDPHDVSSWPVLTIGIIGLAVNIVCFLILRSGAEASLNVRGAYLEVMSDALGSVGVIIAAIAMSTTGATWVDPAVAVAIGVFILPRAWRLGRDALRVLVQAAPAGIDIDEVRDALHHVGGVTGVHDLHLWTLTSEMDVVTAHLAVAAPDQAQQVLDEALGMLTARFGLAHATLQVEAASERRCEDLDW